MKNKIDFSKVMKAICIIAIIALVFFYSQNVSTQRYNDREDIWLRLSTLAEDLATIRDNAYDAYDDGGYDYMLEELYSVYSKCEELSKEAENLADKFADKDQDYDERRSWWY